MGNIADELIDMDKLEQIEADIKEILAEEGQEAAEEALADRMDAAADKYDEWRDNEGDLLFEALKEVYDKFVKGKGYYKNSPAKFLQHAISHLEMITKKKNKKRKKKEEGRNKSLQNY